MDFTWLGAEQELSAAALTVRAQTIPLDDNGTLLWPNFAPRRNVDSFDIQSIDTINYRPVADRREWNARGRLIPVRTPGTREISWVPVEAYFKIAEDEINRLLNTVRGNQQLFRDMVRVSIPARTDDLVTANLRRIETDWFTAWLLGQITQRNPQTGATQTISLGLDATRYETAATAWNGAVNAYDEALAFAERAMQAMGPIRGLAMRLSTLREIQADAPAGIGGVPLTRTQVEDRLGQDLGTPFRFFVIESTVDMFTDGGLATTPTKVWPTGRVAAIPANGTVGETLFAPVSRAYNISATVPKANIDVRGMTVYHEAENGGRGLTVECQVNAFPLPIERNVYVINAGV